VFATYARKKRNMFTFLAMLLAFAVFVAGCGSQQTVSEKGGEETKKEEATRTVKHAMGASAKSGYSYQ